MSLYSQTGSQFPTRPQPPLPQHPSQQQLEQEQSQEHLRDAVPLGRTHSWSALADATTTATDQLKVIKNPPSRVDQLKTVQDEARNLFSKKNADYGDAFATYGTIGVLVRLGDKVQRLQSITNRSITMVEDEKIRDTLMDLHNYAAMAIMLLDEKQDKE